MAEMDKIKLVNENGEVQEFELVEKIELDENKYALLALVGDEDDAFVYKIVEIEGKEEYIPVEDDEEFERVMEEYESYFDEE